MYTNSIAFGTGWVEPFRFDDVSDRVWMTVCLKLQNKTKPQFSSSIMASVYSITAQGGVTASAVAQPPTFKFEAEHVITMMEYLIANDQTIINFLTCSPNALSCLYLLNRANRRYVYLKLRLNLMQLTSKPLALGRAQLRNTPVLRYNLDQSLYDAHYPWTLGMQAATGVIRSLRALESVQNADDWNNILRGPHLEVFRSSVQYYLAIGADPLGEATTSFLPGDASSDVMHAIMKSPFIRQERSAMQPIPYRLRTHILRANASVFADIFTNRPGLQMFAAVLSGNYIGPLRMKHGAGYTMALPWFKKRLTGDPTQPFLPAHFYGPKTCCWVLSGVGWRTTQRLPRVIGHIPTPKFAAFGPLYDVVLRTILPSWSTALTTIKIPHLNFGHHDALLPLTAELLDPNPRLFRAGRSGTQGMNRFLPPRDFTCDFTYDDSDDDYDIRDSLPDLVDYDDVDDERDEEPYPDMFDDQDAFLRSLHD